MKSEIELAAAVLRNSHGAEDHAVHQALVDKGIDKHVAARLVEFLPMAYCRVLLTPRGVRFSDVFRRVLPSGDHFEERELSRDPIWNAILGYARKEIETGIAEEQIVALAARSAEYDAVNRLVEKGSRLEDLVLTPVALLWPDTSPSTSNEQIKARKRWWSFWS